MNFKKIKKIICQIIGHDYTNMSGLGMTKATYAIFHCNRCESIMTSHIIRYNSSGSSYRLRPDPYFDKYYSD